MPIGPSTLTAPYIFGLEPNVTVTSFLTSGDQVGFKSDGTTPWIFGGIPDGMGAFDNGDGTFTLVVNHEYTSSSGIVRDHGAKGAYVSKLTIDKTTLAVTHGEDLIKQLYLENDATGEFELTTTYAMGRLCSADLAPVSAYYWVDTNGTASTADDVAYGTQDRIFMTGEETNVESKEFAVFVTGVDAGKAFEFADCGLFAWENNLASPFAQKKTITIGQDDGQNGQVYVYVGEKQATGTEFEKAGLDGGHLYGVRVLNLVNATPALSNESDAAAASGRFELYDEGVVGALTGATLDANSEAAGVTSFNRPEDGAWDTLNPNVYWFVTTASATGQSRLYKMTYDDITNPTAGGTIEAVLDSNQLPVNGTVGPRMMDNITVTATGKILIEEDIGNNAHLGRIFEYDPTTDTLTALTSHNVNQFTTGQTGFITQDEENSGIIDVTALLGITGAKAYLTTDQVHTTTGVPTEQVEKGQLQLITVADVKSVGTKLADTLNGDATANTMSGGLGDDTINGGSGADTLKGEQGNDQIIGGAGDDTINGGLGIDKMTGGDGADTFDLTRFVAKAGGAGVGQGKDTITDFVHGTDHILLSAGDSIIGKQQVTDWDGDGRSDDVRITLSTGAQVFFYNNIHIDVATDIIFI